MRLKDACSLEENLYEIWHHIKKQRYYFANKGSSSQSHVFSSSHVWMWELDHKESWALKNWCFWTLVLEKTLESHLDCKEIKAVNPEGNQPWILLGRTDAEAEASIPWLPDGKRQLIRKDPDARKDGGWKTGVEGDSRGWDGWMASLTQWTWVWASSSRWWRTGKSMCCSPYCHKESDMIEQLNNKSLIGKQILMRSN